MISIFNYRFESIAKEIEINLIGFVVFTRGYYSGTFAFPAELNAFKILQIDSLLLKLLLFYLYARKVFEL